MNKNVICPIEFLKPGEDWRESPIEFVAKQRLQDGRLKEIVVDDPMLAGLIIPEGVNENQFSDCYKRMLQQMDVNNPADNMKTSKTEIIRSSSEEKELANYELKPIVRRIYIDRNGMERMNLNDVQVHIKISTDQGVVDGEFSIRYVELSKLASIVSKTFPEAILFDRKDAIKIENDLRKKISVVPIKRCLLDAGWQMLDGKKIYLHALSRVPGFEVKTNLSLPSYSNYTPQDVKNIWYQAMNIYGDFGIAGVLNIYAFLGISYKCFEEAGYAPHFLLFMSGKTGSFKTTLAKILYTQLCDERFREYPRRIDMDTPVSFERGIVGSGRDTVTLIDDYSPAKSKVEAVEMGKRLEIIIRMVGDGSTKSRSNTSLEDCRGEGVKGTVVLTGELRGKGLSSNLRCLYCEIIQENVNVPCVSWFQENAFAYTTLIQHFAIFLSNNWDQAVTIINESFEDLRKTAERSLREKRLVDTLVTLWIMADIIGIFLDKYCGENPTGTKKYIESVKSSLIAVVQRSEMDSKEENPAYIFMRTVVNLIEHQGLKISDKRFMPHELALWDGFYENGFLYLQPINAYRQVNAWLKLGGMYFGIDINQLGSLLCNEGYAVGTSNGLNKKIYFSRIDLGDGKKIKFLKIPIDKIEHIQQLEGGEKFA